MEWLISDLHFCHKNILQFEPPRNHFNSLEEMNEEIIKNWNETVLPQDIVWFLGDIGIGNEAQIIELASRLNGKINFIHGNHDNSKLVKGLKKIGWKDNGYMIRWKANRCILYLSHFPMDIGERPNQFSIHGHIHSNESRLLNQINVCTDSDLFNTKLGEPVLLKDVLDLVEVRRQMIIDKKNSESA